MQSSKGDIDFPCAQLLSSGSNCSAVIVDDRDLVYWGEFSSGILRIQKEDSASLRMRKRRQINASPMILSKKARISSFRPVHTPKLVQLPITTQRIKIKVGYFKCQSILISQFF